MAIKLVLAEQKHTLTAQRKLQPDKTNLREALLKCRLTVANFDDQHPIIREEARCIMQDRYHRIQTVSACREAEFRLVGEFGRQVCHILKVYVRRIADDDVIDILARLESP